MPLRGILWLTGVIALAGCTSVPFRETAQPRGSREDQEIADRFLSHWNQNAKQINSVVCRAVDVSGSSEGQSYTLDAMLAFQEPNNFRLTGKFLGKHEADLGSNNQEVWFWMARAQPPAVYFCKREDLPRVSLPMPFHPDDLIQVLGSVPLDPSRFRFEKGWDRFVTLIASETAPSGDPVVKRIVVDRETGRAARFEVWDLYSNQPRKLAEAEILRYHEDASGVFVPQKVKLRFPAAQTDLMLTMRSRSIEVNQIDDQWAANLFSRGNYVNSQVVDLGEEFRRKQASLDRPPLAMNRSSMLPASSSARIEPAVLPTSDQPRGETIVRQSPTNEETSSTAVRLDPQVQPTSASMDVRLPAEMSDGTGIPKPFEGIKPGAYKPKIPTGPIAPAERFD
ncbi:hypothetical protein K2X85_01680 [bacterium]|jgi:hypothetical protein|nr:hypothetical protein [bacterium]